MRAMFERYAERLTPEERRGVWERVAEARSGSRARPAWRWLAPVTASAAAVLVLFAGWARHSGRDSTPASATVTGSSAFYGHSGAEGVGEAPVPRAVALRRRGAESMMGVTERAPVSRIESFEELELRSERVGDARPTVSSDRLASLPVDHLGDAVATKSGARGHEGDLHFRGGRAGEVRYQIGGTAAGDPLAGRGAPAPLSVSAPEALHQPQGPGFDAMSFRHYGVNGFVATDQDALSTFAVDVDAASYTVTRNYVRNGALPPPDAVRVEEFVNYFAQDYPTFGGEDFRILVDGAPSPFGTPDLHLLRVGLKGRELLDEDRKPARLTFVIDVSGSMNRENRLELVKRALTLLVDELRDDDRVGIVVYGSTARDVLEPVNLGGDAGRRRVLEAIASLRPDGSTNAEAGLRLGYAMARRVHRPEAINRIVLCSDGVANVGVTGPEAMLEVARTEADRGIHLTTVGFGMGNYNDVLMEQLANRGDGNHYYVDEIEEARRVFVENLTGTLQTIAKDAKVQVEFDRDRVRRYRLLGFENRDVADRDFRNDAVDAGEIGVGHAVTALYEVELAPGVERGTIATVRLRYARTNAEKGARPDVREIVRRFDARDLATRFEHAAPRFRFDAAVAEFAEILRGSEHAKGGRLEAVAQVARDAARRLNDPASAEFLTLVERAAALRREGGPALRVRE